MPDCCPVLVNERDTGGAGTATRRIHDGLRELGVDSKLLVRRKSSDDPSIVGPETRRGRALARLRPKLDDAPLRLYGDGSSFSMNWVPDRIPRRVGSMDPDVVHLNWVGDGFMSVSSLGSFDVPVVWRFPDVWPMTGGCHYPGECDGFEEACGECPQLESDRAWDPSRLTLRRKRRALSDADVTVVAPSLWLAELANESTLFADSRVEVIPNGLDTDVFRPVDPTVGRTMFGFPSDCQLVLFGAVGPLNDRRKGFDLLQEALGELEGDATELVVFGTDEPANPPDFGFHTHYTGYLRDEQSLALLYAAVDVMVVPSRYEGFGQTVTEAMACGTPVVAFDVSGPSTTVVHEETGYLAEPHDPVDLAHGIRWVLADGDRTERLGGRARQRAVAEYDIADIARAYLDLYRDLQ